MPDITEQIQLKKYCFFICFLLFGFSRSIGQTEITVEAKATQLVHLLEEHHLAPKKVDDSIVSTQIHESFIAHLDPYHRFFTKQDIEANQSLIASIGEKIKAGDVSYFHRMTRHFILRVEESNKWLSEEGLAQRLLKTSYEVSDESVDMNQRKEQFLGTIRAAILWDIIENEST